MQEYTITVTMIEGNAFIVPREPEEDREAYSIHTRHDVAAGALCTVFYRRGELTAVAIEELARMYLARMVNQQ